MCASVWRFWVWKYIFGVQLSQFFLFFSFSSFAWSVMLQANIGYWFVLLEPEDNFFLHEFFYHVHHYGQGGCVKGFCQVLGFYFAFHFIRRIFTLLKLCCFTMLTFWSNF